MVDDVEAEHHHRHTHPDVEVLQEQLQYLPFLDDEPCLPEIKQMNSQ
jgi:hypothetical protein